MRSQTDLEENGVIFPKVFRRLTEYLRRRGGDLSEFLPWLEVTREQVLELPTMNFTHFEDVVDVQGNTIKLRPRPAARLREHQEYEHGCGALARHLTAGARDEDQRPRRGWRTRGLRARRPYGCSIIDAHNELTSPAHAPSSTSGTASATASTSIPTCRRRAKSKRSSSISSPKPWTERVREAAAVQVAALYDVEGNMPALEAVLAELERIQPDAIVFGGDLFCGAQPVEVIDRARSLPTARFLLGNADRLDEPKVAHQVALLRDDQRQFVATFPEKLDNQRRALSPRVAAQRR